MKSTNKINSFLSENHKVYLKEKLTSVYKNYFPFEKAKPIDQYFESNGVHAEQDALGNPRVSVKVELSPLRIEVTELENQNRRVVWQMIGL